MSKETVSPIEKLAGECLDELSAYFGDDTKGGAWKHMREILIRYLEKARTDGYADGHDDGSAPSSKDYGRDS